MKAVPHGVNWCSSNIRWLLLLFLIGAYLLYNVVLVSAIQRSESAMCIHICCCLVSQSSCPTLLWPIYCSLPGSSVHGTFQVRVLEWVAMSSSRGSSQPRDQTWVSCIAVRFFIDRPLGKSTPALAPPHNSQLHWPYFVLTPGANKPLAEHPDGWFVLLITAVWGWLPYPVPQTVGSCWNHTGHL